MTEIVRAEVVKPGVHVEIGMGGEAYVVVDYDEMGAFDYVVFHYRYPFTDNASVRASAVAMAVSLGAVEPVAVSYRGFSAATPAPAQPDPLHVANERGEGWQPIESVPGTPEPVLLWTRAGAVRVETGWYAKNLLDESKEDDFECAFTHWRQQLAGPASPTPAQEEKT